MSDKELVSMSNLEGYGLTVTDSELVFPRLTLIQPTSSVEGNGYILNITGEVFDVVNCVFLKNTLGRVMFNPDRSKQEAICGSNDRILPASRFPNPIKSRCMECNFHRRGYTEVETTENEKPLAHTFVKQVKQCDETVSLIGMFTDTIMPFVIVFKRTALVSVNQFLTLVAFRVQAQKLMLHNFVVQMSVKLITKPQQKYYVPVLAIKETKSDDMFKSMFDKVKDFNFDKTFEADKEAPISDEEGVL